MSWLEHELQKEVMTAHGNPTGVGPGLSPTVSKVTTSKLLCSIGIQGVLDAYRMCITQVSLYGPTNFSPIILHVAQFAAAAKRENSAKVCGLPSL